MRVRLATRRGDAVCGLRERDAPARQAGCAGARGTRTGPERTCQASGARAGVGPNNHGAPGVRVVRAGSISAVCAVCAVCAVRGNAVQNTWSKNNRVQCTGPGRVFSEQSGGGARAARVHVCTVHARTGWVRETSFFTSFRLSVLLVLLFHSVLRVREEIRGLVGLEQGREHARGRDEADADGQRRSAVLVLVLRGLLAVLARLGRGRAQRLDLRHLRAQPVQRPVQALGRLALLLGQARRALLVLVRLLRLDVSVGSFWVGS